METVADSFERHLIEAFAAQENPLRPWALVPTKQISKKTLKLISEIAEVRVITEGNEEFYAFSYNALFGEVFSAAQEKALVAGKKV